MARQITRATVLKARKLRKERSLPEALLWRELKAAAIKFRQQHPIGPFIVDLYCPAAKTCIEIDGSPTTWAIRLSEMNAGQPG